MKIKLPYQDNSLGSLFINLGVIVGLTLVLAISYFYIYLPAITHHGDSITVPNLEGMKAKEAEEFLAQHDLRYALEDSAYSDKSEPLTILRQLPKAGAKVKEGRIIYVSINRVTPPTMPLPDLLEKSLTNAEVVLRSNELRRGRIYYEPSPYHNLIREMRYLGRVIEPGTRIPKGSVIDLVVTDGRGPADFVVGNLIGDTYERAIFKLGGWNLHLGKVQIPEGVDTTGVEPVVFKQDPLPGDSVRVGDPIYIWIAPKGYQPATDDIDNKN